MRPRGWARGPRFGSRRALAVALVGGAAFLACESGRVQGQAVSRTRVGSYRADDWITLGDFRHVTSVAVTVDVAYLGTTGGVERFDTLRDAWLSPVTAADGLPDDVVTSLAAEPAGGDVWVGTARGLARLSAHSGEVDPAWGPPPARVDDVRIDPRDGTVYARVAGVWWVGGGGSPVLERFSAAPPPGTRGPVAVDDIDPFDLPWIDPLYVRSPVATGEVFRLTALDRDPRGDWYVGTWGDNGRRWGAGRASWETLYFGLAGPGGGPVVRAVGGTWFVPGAGSSGALGAELRAATAGVSRAALAAGSPASDALAYAGDDGGWSYAVPGLTPGLPSAAAHAALALGDTLYLGSDQGLTRLTRDGPPSEQVAAAAATTWGWREGPLGPVTALAADGARLWIGTPDGLVLWDRAAEGPTGRLLEGRSVTAVLPADGVLFVGTEDGLFVGPRAAGPAGAGFAPDSFGRAETFGRTIHALAARDTLLLVASDAGLEVFDRRTGEWFITRAGEGRLPSAPLALAVDDEQVWIGTREGLVRWRPATDEWEPYDTADGLAGGPVLHLLAEPDAVWASTPAGVTRFAWRRARQ